MSNAKLINLICIGVTLLEQIGFSVIKTLVLCVDFIIRKKLVPLLLVKNLCFVVKQKKYNQQKIQLGSNMTRLIAVNDLFASGYVEAIAELGLEVINSPRAEFKDIKRDEGFKVTVTVEYLQRVLKHRKQKLQVLTT